MSHTLRILPHLPRTLSHRAFSTTPPPASSPFTSGPAPPRLPKEDQELFEKLQKASTGAFSQPRDMDATPPPPSPNAEPSLRMRINQSPDSVSATGIRINQSPDSTSSSTDANSTPTPTIQKGEEFHPNMRRGAPPEFEGDVNPKTGEVGGPKNEPLRWGASADWSYNGRVTDF
ncbi:DUF1674-domain-containing protein [Plenodomus tracheiphilus IPT5]|uniref:Succinate dehydrogenase assembly factor 4, mitochondrial n=1 Tax=Plenodomus tracheiphilus IPT5 TaxID=1408161 RepID=A0A6A7AYI9_9PLEO|nr:DUF1674-domain-containing protein [Plenodomus tracheiphilus IPT5]